MTLIRSGGIRAMRGVNPNFDKLQAAYPGAPGTATAAQKILAVSEGLGIQGMEIQQATTRTIYDTLPLDGRTVFNFFDGCNARTFPNTNLSENKLQVGEAMIIENMTFQVVTEAVEGVITATAPMSATATSYYASDFSIVVANQVILKPLSLGQYDARFNKDSYFATNENYRFFTLLSIPEMQQFVCTLRTTDSTVVATKRLKLTLEGTGVIYRPKNAL